jgi:glutamyl-tRNA synthetase
MMHAPHDEDDEPLYNGRCRSAPPVPFNSTANYRFRVPDGETVHFLDRNLGPQSFTAGMHFGDFLVWRKPVPGDPHPGGLPSYQLACVIDDDAMRITEVVRGADLLKSTARQILLQRALGLPTVDYFHTALLRDEQGVRLAKRHDALALRTLRQQGLTPADVLALIH